MVFITYKELKENRKPGDKVFGVRKNSFIDTRPDNWDEVHPIKGMLQSSYYDHPKNGPYPPRHLAPANNTDKHSWDDSWWNVEDWIICDTLQEAEIELDAQMRAAIAKLKEQILMLEHLLPSVKAETTNDKGELDIPPVYRRDLSPTVKEIMSHCTGKTPVNLSDGDLFAFSEFKHFVECKGISDYDGFGDLVVDYFTYDNIYIWCNAKRIIVSDRFEIPFERMEQLFKGHTLKVQWYNK